VTAPTVVRKTPRWRFIVPNAITCGSLVVGLAAIAGAFVTADFAGSAWLVILAVLLDKLDGTVARLLRATSAIGMQLDSFADFVTFGIAPGALLFASGLHARAGGGSTLWAGEAGLVLLAALSATYVVCTCLRLAKFNVLQDVLPADGPKVFYGMPSTFAGGLVAVLYLLGDKYGATGMLDALPLVSLAFALLMVSNLPLPKVVMRKATWLNAIQIVSVVTTYAVGLLRILPEYLAFNIAVYAAVGFAWGLKHRRRLLAARRLDLYPDHSDEAGGPT
jgi:CDP-diacylglycerol--serine O-phosphatidyltransferase